MVGILCKSMTLRTIGSASSKTNVHSKPESESDAALDGSARRQRKDQLRYRRDHQCALAPLYPFLLYGLSFPDQDTKIRDQFRNRLGFRIRSFTLGTKFG